MQQEPRTNKNDSEASRTLTGQSFSVFFLRQRKVDKLKRARVATKTCTKKCNKDESKNNKKKERNENAKSSRELNGARISKGFSIAPRWFTLKVLNLSNLLDFPLFDSNSLDFPHNVLRSFVKLCQLPLASVTCESFLRNSSLPPAYHVFFHEQSSPKQRWHIAA